MSPAATHDLTDPAFYEFFTEERIRFSDTDMVGHVNNVGHTALVETGRIQYALSLAERYGGDFGSIMFVRLELDFVTDLYWPGHVRIGGRVVGVGNSSFRIATSTFNAEGQCVAKAINVMVNLGEDRRPAPLPDAFRAVLEAELPA